MMIFWYILESITMLISNNTSSISICLNTKYSLQYLMMFEETKWESILRETINAVIALCVRANCKQSSRSYGVIVTAYLTSYGETHFVCNELEKVFRPHNKLQRNFSQNQVGISLKHTQVYFPIFIHKLVASLYLRTMYQNAILTSKYTFKGTNQLLILLILF